MTAYRDPTTGQTTDVQPVPLKRHAATMQAQADLRREQQAIMDGGGFGTFEGLYHGDTRLRAKLVQGKFGLSWLLAPDEAERRGVKWVTSGPTSRKQKAMGLRERRELAPAEAVLEGGKVTVRRLGDPWGSDARPKFTPTTDKDS